MGYRLAAVIAPAGVLGGVVRFAHGHVAGLAQGLALLPMTEQLVDEVERTGGEPPPRGFVWMPDGLVGYLREWSTHGPLAYVEADYFAGIGDQWAGTWHHGQQVAFFSASDGERVTPMSRALRWLGATRGTAYDEFEAVGLDRYRSTDDWSDAAPIPRPG